MSISRLTGVVFAAALACSRDAPPDETRANSNTPDTTTQSGAASLELRLGTATYAPADTLRLQLINRTSGEVGYNLCTARLEHRSGDAWIITPDDRMCTMELRLLAPGDSAGSERVLDRAVQPGEYRLVAVVDAAGQTREIASRPFTVSARVSP